MDILDLLKETLRRQGSDLHLSSGLPPLVRVHGEITRLDGPFLAAQDVVGLMTAVMSPAQLQAFERKGALDFACTMPGLSRFRVHMYQQQRGPAAAWRVVPPSVPELTSLQGPPMLADLAMRAQGLVLVTGPTGSGKSTSLAALVDHRNRRTAGHILTIEDPIEFVHQSKKSLINQREVHRDTHAFSAALRSALREDPDTILVGEMRDLETIRLALTAAETGHLVFGTLHTSSAAKTIDRLVDVFPAEEKEMVRAMLSESLRAVISQTLLKKNGGGRIAAHEIMIGTPAIRNLIRENKIAQMYSAIQTGHQVGMQTLDQCLQKLVSQGLVSKIEARFKAQNKDLF